MTQHEHQCFGCHPERFRDVAPSPIVEGHIAVRWGDFTNTTGLSPFIEGRSVGNYCMEAIPGEQGFAHLTGGWRNDAPKHLCPCSSHDLCTEDFVGPVEVRSVVRTS